MANLLEIAQVAYDQLYPNADDETALDIEHFIASAKLEYSYQMLLFYWKVKNDEGYFEFPSYLLSEKELPVVNNKIDISSLKVFRSLPMDLWLQNVGGLNCGCKYVKSSVNAAQLFCGDDTMSNEVRTFIPLSNEIIFPLGTHTNNLSIIYANMGENVNDRIEVEDSIGAVVRTRLIEIFGGGKTGKEDLTNNTNSET